jgi:hypothetical protein
MYEMKISRKRIGWEWRVSDLTGKVAVAGREISRSTARYRAAHALFQLLLKTISIRDRAEKKRRQRR